MPLGSPVESYHMASNYGIFMGTLEFRWGFDNEDTTIVANQIDMIEFRLRDFELPMLASREIVVSDMDRRFAAEIDLDERPWKPRSKVTTDYYDKYNMTYSTILRKDDHLHEAVTDRDSYQVYNNDMFIDTSNWPVYWHAHDAGSTVGRGVKLPARSFAGISERAQFEIVDIFDAYLANVLDIIPAGKTGIPSYRGAFGRIAGPITSGMGRPHITPIVPGIVPTGTGMG